MDLGTLTRYNASAGSGKTYKLTGVYLDYLFRQSNSYRKILAVTFTNKAAAEMKERILGSLFDLASGLDSDYLVHLIRTTGSSRKLIEKEARINLDSILHDYSRFSVGTIDSFFQKILRSFARESGLHAGFNLILDPTLILSEAVDNLMKEADSNPVLLKWLTEYAYNEVQAGKHWNLKRKIEELGSEIFRENYRLLYEANSLVKEKEVLISSLAELNHSLYAFQSTVKNLGGEGLKLLNRYNVSDDMLFQKSKGIGKFLRDTQDEVPDNLSASLLAAVQQNKYTALKKEPEALSSALSDGLHNILSELMSYFEENITHYKSVKLVLGNLYTLGLLTDISEKVRKILGEKNRFLLSDAGDVLRQIIGKDQTPFIYEKVGNQYTNFMIDEFQDTSRIQWDNFLPLIRNSMAEGDGNLVVGDIKQAIYRWRNSDWRIFNYLDREFFTEQFISEVLAENWRSCTNIIKFNNRLFSILPGAIEEKLELGSGTVSELYSEVRQKDPGKSSGGLVRIERVNASETTHQDILILNKLPLLIEEIEDAGYSPSDIGILVRTNIEGQKVIDAIMNYASDLDPVKSCRYSYQVISQDSLMLASNPSVKLIISLLRYLIDSEDRIAKASIAHFYAQTQDGSESEKRPGLIFAEYPGKNDASLPEGFEEFIQKIRFLPLFEITDRIIDYFKLSECKSGIPFITTFQDLVLELSGSEANDIPLFLEWWDSEGHKKSVSSPEQPGAIQLMTMHKSKGLQFKVVIIPFLSWTFNHGKNPIIWVQSDLAPFDKMGALPVPYKQEIADTYFSSYYEEERTQAAIDRLNLLYVAFTRARECLFGFVPVGRDVKHCGKYIMDAIGDGIVTEKDGAPSGTWSDDRSCYSFGSFPQLDRQPDILVDGLDLPYGVEVNDSRLRLSLNSSSYINDNISVKADSINYGLLMHNLFESVIYKEDFKTQLNKMLISGRITTDQKDVLSQKIESALKNDLVLSWFNDFKEIRNEAGILLKGGILKRPDRVIIRDDSVTIVDFKFGTKEEGYSKQLKEYRSLLKEMGYKNIKAYLWFVEIEKIVEIS